MGWPELVGNGQKIKKLPVTLVVATAASPARSRRFRRRLAVKFYGRLRMDVLLPHVRCVYSESVRNRLLWFKLERPTNGLKRPILVLTGLRSFSRVFGAQSECLGLGFPLARKAMYI